MMADKRRKKKIAQVDEKFQVKKKERVNTKIGK